MLISSARHSHHPLSSRIDRLFRKKNTPLTLVVNLDVSDDVISSRVSNRWVHLPSGRVYNLSYNPPKVQGRDDYTGELLTKRPDDNPVRTFHLPCDCSHSYMKYMKLSRKRSPAAWPSSTTLPLPSFPITQTHTSSNRRLANHTNTRISLLSYLPRPD
jgi:hypothetical protein